MGALARKTIVVSEPARVDLRLRELGLSISILIEAMKSGLSSAALCHAYHPPNFPGLTLWAEAIRWLRDALVPKGWRSDNSHNLPTVVRGDKGLAIAVVRGGPGTGNPKAKSVSTQYARGPAMKGRVEENGILPYDHLPPEYFEDHTDAKAPTWLLMHRRLGDELVCEMSFPTNINKSAISEFPKWRKYLISLSFRGQSSVRPVQVGGFDVNIVIHRSTAVRGRGGPARHDAWPPSLGAILAHTDGPCGS